MINPLPIRSRKITMRSSGMTTYRECARKFMLQERHGLAPIAEHSSALHTGTLLHTIITSLYMGLDLPDAENMAIQQNAREQSDLIEIAARPTFGGYIGGKKIEVLLKDLAHELSLARMMAALYWKHYRTNTREFDVVPEFIEAPLEYKHHLYTSTFHGRMDLLLRHKETGHYWIWDLKTLVPTICTRQRSDTFLMDPQPWFYWLMADYTLRNREYCGNDSSPPKVAGCIHIVMQKPSIRYCGKDATFNDYIDRCQTEFYEPRFNKFKRGLTNGPPILVSKINMNQLPGWMNPLLYEFDQACSRRVGSSIPGRSYFDDWPPNNAACYNWNRPCQFLRLCQANEKMWPAYTKSHFKQDFRDDREEREDEANNSGKK